MFTKCIPFLLLCAPLFGERRLEQQSMLYQAEEIAKKYTLEVAKTAPPPLVPQTRECLDLASVWFTLDLNQVAVCGEQSVFGSLLSDELWEYLREIGIQALYLKGLKQGGDQRTGLGLDPRWGTESEWKKLAAYAQRKGIALVGDGLGNATGMGPDFILALKNFGEYPGLYHLIEIAEKDWKLLPKIPTGQTLANVPWLKLQELHKKGYVPEQFSPWMKESQWNATAKICGTDGTSRRWIFLKENRSDPQVDWLAPSFGGVRVASADILDSVYHLGQKITRFDAKISRNAKETLALWNRKIGAFSVQEVEGGIASMGQASGDLVVDSLTPSALLHALIAEDAEALKLIYRLFLEEEIDTKRLLHALQPFDQYACDWAEFICSPRKKFSYYEEQITGEALRLRLLKEDASRIAEGGPIPLCTWTGYCASALGIKDFEKHASDIADAHLLLAFFYVMQPGAFSFSASDLIGALQKGSIHLMGANPATLYSCLPNQFKNCRSFALRMKQMLQVRRDYALESARLMAVPRTCSRNVLLLIHRMPDTGFVQFLAINFGRTAARETIDMPQLSLTNAINLLTGHSEEKTFESSSFKLDLPPLSGKVVLFQPKYYD